MASSSRVSFVTQGVWSSLRMGPKGRVYLVSNDQMRDHHFQARPPHPPPPAGPPGAARP